MIHYSCDWCGETVPRHAISRISYNLLKDGNVVKNTMDICWGCAEIAKDSLKKAIAKAGGNPDLINSNNEAIGICFPE